MAAGVGGRRGARHPVAGGEPIPPDKDVDRQYFVLTVDETELEHEVDRLVSLGARLDSSSASPERTLRDPDGAPFLLRTP